MTYVDLRPDNIREVQVLIDGTWHTGDLEAYRHDRHGWAGYVSHTTAPGSTFLGWYLETRLRTPPESTQPAPSYERR